MLKSWCKVLSFSLFCFSFFKIFKSVLIGLSLNLSVNLNIFIWEIDYKPSNILFIKTINKENIHTPIWCTYIIFAYHNFHIIYNTLFIQLQFTLYFSCPQIALNLLQCDTHNYQRRVQGRGRIGMSHFSFCVFLKGKINKYFWVCLNKCFWWLHRGL